MKRNSIISNWLKEKGSQETAIMVKRNLAIANKVRAALKEKDMKDGDLAKLLEKSPSEISKWLSGTHNFTMKSIIKLELALGITLIYVEQVHKYVYLGTIKGALKDAPKPYSDDNYESNMPAYAS